MAGLDDDTLQWGPSRAVFLKRVILSGGVTFVALALVGIAFASYNALPYIWAGLVALILTLGFVLDDVLRWRSLRLDQWRIEGRLLIHEGEDGRADIPLSEIISISSRFGSRVILKLTSGQRIAMRYLSDAKAIAAQIETARGPRAR